MIERLVGIALPFPEQAIDKVQQRIGSPEFFE
jgi:hypothetical protein